MCRVCAGSEPDNAGTALRVVGWAAILRATQLMEGIPVVRLWMRSGFLIAAVMATVLVSQAAYASTPLPDATVITSNAATGTYTFNTVSDYWSIVAVATSADYDLRLYDVAGALLGTSDYGTGVTDFIAINSNLRPLGTYSATVNHYSGTGSDYVEQRQGHTITALPVPDNDGVTGPSDPDLAFASVNSQDVASVSDIYLAAGQQFWVNVANTGQTFFMLESNPSDPSTFIRTRVQATAIANTRTAQGCTLYTANYTGWHGLVEINPSLPYTSSPQQGTANALDGYDPARPNTCPQRNFPDPTPAGP